MPWLIDSDDDVEPTAVDKGLSPLHRRALDAELQGNTERALELLRLAIEQSPKDVAVAFDLARLAVLGSAGGRRPKTSDVAPLLRLQPKGSEARLLRSYLLAERFNRDSQVATKGSARKVTETPGIVTVVTRDEILAIGCRDLIDVLAHVAGFGFGLDISGLVSMGVRGMWGVEGKVLILVDGHELHELPYLGNYLGGRIPVDWIERVEIIRGPGSVMYGGAAELAVVSIITRAPADLDGVRVVANYGHAPVISGRTAPGRVSDYLRRNVSASIGRRFSKRDNIEFKADVFIGQGNQSTEPFFDDAGTEIYLSDSHKFADGHRRRRAASDPMMANFYGRWGGLTLRYLFENWRRTDQIGVESELLPFPIPLEWKSHSLQIEYDWDPAESVHIMPRLSYAWQNPWRSVGADVKTLPGVLWNLKVQRLTPALVLNWLPTQYLDIVVGADMVIDTTTDKLYGYVDPDDPDATVESLSVTNTSAYTQAMLTVGPFGMTAGARIQSNSKAGRVFLPRFAASCAYGGFHAKALVSEALRMPSIETLATNSELDPERSRAFELEVGYLLSDTFFIRVNGYDFSIRDAIVYGYVPELDMVTYTNGARLGTRGMEVEAGFRHALVSGSVTYATYQARDRNIPDSSDGPTNPYAVPDGSGAFFGMATRTLTGTLRGAPFNDVELGLSVVALLGDRLAYAGTTDDGDVETRGYDREITASIFGRFSNVWVRGFSVGAGIYNLTAARRYYLQPYASNTPDRVLARERMEVMLTASYDWGFETFEIE